MLFVYYSVDKDRLCRLDQRAHAKDLVKIPRRHHTGELGTDTFSLCESFRTQKKATVGVTGTGALSHDPAPSHPAVYLASQDPSSARSQQLHQETALEPNISTMRRIGVRD